MRTTTFDASFFDAGEAAALRRLETLTWFMDQAIPIPGTKRSFGADALMNFVPGLGSAAGAAISAYLLLEAWRLRAPPLLLARMAGNIALDALIGAIPVAGLIADFLFKANVRNLRLLRRHLAERAP